MRKFNLLFLLVLNFLFFSCGSNNGSKKSDFSLKFDKNQSEFRNNESLKASILNSKNKTIDSVRYFLNDEFLISSSGSQSEIFKLNDKLLGNHQFKALVYTSESTDTLSRSIKILNAEPPILYTYEVLNTYPHDKTSYTQGLEFNNGELYESTGQYGKSKLRKVDLETGKVLNEIKLEDQYFAEGITILNGKLYQLTWQEGEGFIYNLDNFEKTGSFGYNQSKEGWGLCNNGKKLFKSDGTEKIWILDPETLAEQSYIQPTHHKAVSTKLNELEWVKGKIYANTYQKDGVAIINPNNGAIEGLINFSGLRDRLGNSGELDPSNDVLNGIAYNPETNKLYVTGKKWDTLFEIKIVKK